MMIGATKKETRTDREMELQPAKFLERHSDHDGDLPTGGLSGVLRLAAPPPDVPVEIVWKRHVGDGVWLCGAAVVDAAARDWWAFVEVL